MMVISFIGGILVFFQFFFSAKAELVVIVTDIEYVPNLNWYAPNHEVFLLDNGIDNELYINTTQLRTVPEHAVISFKIMGATMGEYKIPLGCDFSFTAVEMVKEPIFGRHFFEKMGVKEVPIPPGNYGNSNYIVNIENFPDSFYRNKFIGIVDLRLDDELIFHTVIYFTVQ